VNPEHLERSLKVLLRSDRGRRVLRHLDAFLDHSTSLDGEGVSAVLTLYAAAFGPICMTTREMITDTLEKISLNEV